MIDQLIVLKKIENCIIFQEAWWLHVMLAV